MCYPPGNVPSGYCPHHTRFESLLSKIIDTSLWHSPESSMISPGTFATACDETSKIHNPTSLPVSNNGAQSSHLFHTFSHQAMPLITPPSQASHAFYNSSCDFYLQCFLLPPFSSDVKFSSLLILSASGMNLMEWL